MVDSLIYQDNVSKEMKTLEENGDLYTFPQKYLLKPKSEYHHQNSSSDIGINQHQAYL